MTREIVAAVDAVFRSPHPGEAFLQGSFEGCEPFDEVEAFAGITDRRELDAAFLDAHYSALSFFSEAGFRFFLPAYLAADLPGRLMTADTLFHLVQGTTSSSSIPSDRTARRFRIARVDAYFSVRAGTGR